MLNSSREFEGQMFFEFCASEGLASFREIQNFLATHAERFSRQITTENSY